MSNAPKDYYKILRVDPAAEKEIIDAAYKRLALMYHPDLDKSPNATRKFQEINDAYEILRRYDKRARYDQEREFLQYSKQPEQHYSNNQQKTDYASRQNKSNQQSNDYAARQKPSNQKESKKASDPNNKHSQLRIFFALGAILLLILISCGLLSLLGDTKEQPSVMDVKANQAERTRRAIEKEKTSAAISSPRKTSTPTFTSTPENLPILTHVREADGMVEVYVPEGEFEMGSNPTYKVIWMAIEIKTKLR